MKPVLILSIGEVLARCMKLSDPLPLVCDKQTTSMPRLEAKSPKAKLPVVHDMFWIEEASKHAHGLAHGKVGSWRDRDGCALVHSLPHCHAHATEHTRAY
jgi:hypothetical protein